MKTGGQAMQKSDIGLIGLAVMGENLALNLESSGFSVAVFNRSYEKTRRFIDTRAAGRNIVGYFSPEELCTGLKSPRTIIMMIKAGQSVDELIAQLLPHLLPGDILIDGGNSHFSDTSRRCKNLDASGILYVGCGVSGGELGALHGPSLMPGGCHEAWEHIKPFFQRICAHTQQGQPCCEWIGGGGAGHFVKMVHNGIEYGDMQLICEAYQLLRVALGMEADEISSVFDKWSEGALSGYLMEISRDILLHREYNGELTLDLILDAAGQKGTGKWTVEEALSEAVPITLIAQAVFARFISSMKSEREKASVIYPRDIPEFRGNRDEFIEFIRCALHAGKIISYAQGFELMQSASEKYGWDIDCSGTARIWQGGCIIQSVFLSDIAKAYDKDPHIKNLLFDAHFSGEIKKLIPAWRKVVAYSARAGISTPALSSALSYFDGYTTLRSPANLLQAQRDYFGAHGYERIDAPRGKFFHTNWTGHGGDTGAGNYNA